MFWQDGFVFFETVTIRHFQRIFEDPALQQVLHSSNPNFPLRFHQQ